MVPFLAHPVQIIQMAAVDRDERPGVHRNGGGDWRRSAEHCAQNETCQRETGGNLVPTDVRRRRLLSSARRCSPRSQV